MKTKKFHDLLIFEKIPSVHFVLTFNKNKKKFVFKINKSQIIKFSRNPPTYHYFNITFSKTLITTLNQINLF